MTPKEKAEELLNRFSKTHLIGVENTKGKLVSPYSSGYASIIVRNERAKKSALIAVDELIEYSSQWDDDDYWQQVKTEIKKL